MPTAITEADEVLRVSEIYASVQAEGPRTGMGTVFLRFGGCNLRCPGWPCDTLYAVLPEHRDEWTKYSAGSLLAEVRKLCKERNIANVCLTGGEPFIQNGNALEILVDGLLEADIHVEAFSNGQVRYPVWALDNVSFIMDWKLPGSGNASDKNETTMQLVLSNLELLKETDCVKFVIKDSEDFIHAIDVWERYETVAPVQWWAGIVWDNGNITEANLVDMILDESLPWNVNVQMHKYLWHPKERGV